MFLSNRHKYTIQRIIALMISPFVFTYGVFLKRNNDIVLTGSLNNEYADNARVLFEYLYEHHSASQVYFVLNDSDKRRELNKIYPGRFISNKSYHDLRIILRAKYWFCSAMELPIQSVLERKRRTVVHLGHGMLYKKIGRMESGGGILKKFYYTVVASNITFSLANTQFFVPYISRGFGLPESRVRICCHPKISLVLNPASICNSTLEQCSGFHILYAPTWRPYADVALFPFRDFNYKKLNSFLLEKNVHIWLRVHPRFEQDIPGELTKMTNVHLFSARDYSEVNSYLSFFNVLITDYSSLYYDFLLLERPVLFFDYDLEEYISKVGLIDEYQSVKCNITTESFSHFCSQVNELLESECDLSRIKLANQICNGGTVNSNPCQDLIDDIFHKS